MSRIRRIVGSAGVFFCAGSSSARGELPPPAAEVFVASSFPEATGRIENAVAARERSIRWIRVAHIDETDVLTRRPEADRVDARVWIDASRSDFIRLFFANRDADRFLVREVRLPDGLDEAALETLAQVIESSMSALLSPGAIGIGRDEMRSQHLGSPSRWRGSYAVYYAFEAFSSESAVAHGPGIRGSVDRRQGRALVGAWLSAQYRWPQIVETSLAGVRLDTVALRAGVQLARATSDRVELAIRLGGGGDLVQVAPRLGSSAAAVSLADSRLTWLWAAQVAIATTVRINATIDLTAAVFTDVDAVLHHYDIEVSSEGRRVFTPWRVHPGLMAGFSWP